MGALANMKETRIGQILTGAFGAFIGMVNFQYEEDESIEEAIKETVKENPEIAGDLNKVIEIVEIENKVLAEMEPDYTEAFGKELGVKDKDGYNKIPDKLDDIGAKVSENEALNTNAKEREKGGRQRTRVDED